MTLVCGGARPVPAPQGRRSVAKQLTTLGVTVLEGPDATVTAVTRDAVQLGDGRELTSAGHHLDAGFGVPDLAARSGLRTDALGRLLTDETLTSVDGERIVAAGDAAAPSDRPLRMSARPRCSWAHMPPTRCWRRIAGERPAPIDLGFPASASASGRRAGIFQLLHKDDTAKRFYFSGSGRKLKEFVCAATVKHLAAEARKPGSHPWPKDAEHRPARRLALIRT